MSSTLNKKHWFSIRCFTNYITNLNGDLDILLNIVEHFVSLVIFYCPACQISDCKVFPSFFVFYFRTSPALFLIRQCFTLLWFIACSTFCVKSLTCLG